MSSPGLCSEVSGLDSAIAGEQSIGDGWGSLISRVGNECADAVLNEGLESCESEERMTIDCPKDGQLGSTVRLGCDRVL